MASTMVDRIDGLSSAAAIKGPCRVATTANITLYGEQTIDGVAVVDGDRVLVKDQTAGYENGLHVVDTGQWRRSKDFNKTKDVVKGTQVYVTDGTLSGGRWFGVTSSNPVIVGTSAISFALSDNLSEIERIYLGAFAVAPTTDLEGDPLQVGAQYFNTVSDTVFTWDGSAWVSNQDLAVYVPPNLTASVQAPPIIKANGYEWSIFAFNGGEAERAKTGTDTDDFRAVFETALTTGEKVRVPAWEYNVRSATQSNAAMLIKTDAPVDVEFASGAKVIPTAELAALNVIGGLFRIVPNEAEVVGGDIANVPPEATLRFIGGFFDTRALPSTNTGMAAIDAYWHTKATIRDTITYGGRTTPVGAGFGPGGGDNAITVHRYRNAEISNNLAIGMNGAAFYISGDNVDYPLNGYGERLVFRGNYAIGCETLLSARRSAVEMIIDGNFGTELINGIIGSPADNLNNHGRGMTVVNNRFNKLIGRPIRLYLGKGDVVANNHAWDYGKWLSNNGGTYTTVASFGWIAAFEFVGCWDGIISGNTAGAREWNMKTGAPANAEIHGAVISDYNSPAGSPSLTVYSRNNKVKDNQFASIYRTTIEATNGPGYNFFEGNSEDDIAARPSVQAATSILTRPLLPYGTSGAINPAAIANGASQAITVTVIGAALGDIVDRVTFSRDILGLSHSATVTGANTVTIVLTNLTGTAVDLGVTEFKVWVRPS